MDVKIKLRKYKLIYIVQYNRKTIIVVLSNERAIQRCIYDLLKGHIIKNDIYNKFVKIK